MEEELLNYLKTISSEEQCILDGNKEIRKELYTSKDSFIIDSKKLLEKGRLIEIRPHTRFAHFPKHRHNYIEMIYMCKGKTTHIINDTQQITLVEGDILLINQYVTQEILPANEEDIAVNFIILPEFFNRPFTMIEKENVLRDFLIAALASEKSEVNYLHFHAQNVLPIKNLIENLIWTLIHKKYKSNTIIQTTMGLLFMNLSEFPDKLIHEDVKNPEQNIIFYALQYIESYYKDGSLANVSKELKLPTYYISRLLKKHTGYNFKELIQNRKLQQAAYLLTQTSLSIDAIINAIGYNNSSYFYRKFKEKYTCSPHEYRSRC